MATQIFYRAVGIAECDDWRVRGRLVDGKGSIEGKWMAKTRSDAFEWSRRFYGRLPFRILAIEVDDEVVESAEFEKVLLH